jgi:hypothetical protein
MLQFFLSTLFDCLAFLKKGGEKKAEEEKKFSSSGEVRVDWWLHLKNPQVVHKDFDRASIAPNLPRFVFSPTISAEKLRSSPGVVTKICLSKT